MNVSGLTVVFQVYSQKNLLQILSVSAVLKHAKQKIQLPLSSSVSHHEAAGHSSPRIAHTYNLLSSIFSPRRFLSLLPTPPPSSVLSSLL